MIVLWPSRDYMYTAMNFVCTLAAISGGVLCVFCLPLALEAYVTVLLDVYM
jgi:hypothetical protein